MSRDPTIDTVRGLAIAGMILYTVAPQISHDLPSVLAHNDFNRLLIGDFVFPLFLFTSGMSLAFLSQRIRERGWDGILKKLMLQALTLAIFSPITTGQFLGMDEVGMNLVLFFPCLATTLLSTPLLISLQTFITALYFVFQHEGWLPDFRQTYLGGYYGAFWYLPIMIGGVLAIRLQYSLPKLAIMAFLVSALLTSIIQPLKMISSPSFMMLSIGVCSLVVWRMRGVRNAMLEYLGARPLRVWILQFLLVLGPLRLGVSRLFGVPEIQLNWPWVFPAAGMTLAVIVGASLLVDRRVRTAANRP